VTLSFSYAMVAAIHLSGKRDAILKRPATDPLIIHTQECERLNSRAPRCAHRYQGQRPRPAETSDQYVASSSICQSLLKKPTPASAKTSSTPSPLDAVPPPRSTDGPLGTARACRRRRAASAPRAARSSPWRNGGRASAIRAFATPRGERAEAARFRPRIRARPPRQGAADVAPGEGYVLLVPAVDGDGNDVRGSACRWWRARSAPIRVGTCAPAASATARRMNSPAARSPSPIPPRAGPAIRAARAGAYRGRRPMSRRSPKRRKRSSPKLMSKRISKPASRRRRWGRRA